MANAISPRKLRSDLYFYDHNNSQEEPNMPLVISVLASLIDRNLARNERIAKRGSSSSSSSSSSSYATTRTSCRVFESHEAPDMSIQSYLERIFKYTRAGPPVYVVAYVYIDRLCQKFPDEFRINPSNVHRLLITTIMVASKYVEDMNYRNSYYARVGGLTTKEINKLELDFLFLMGFKLHVNVSVFQSYCSHLEREVSIGGGYQIERALRCAEEIKLTQSLVQRRVHGQIARIAL